MSNEETVEQFELNMEPSKMDVVKAYAPLALGGIASVGATVLSYKLLGRSIAKRVVKELDERDAK